MRGEKKNELYVLIISFIPTNAVMTAEFDVDKTKLWHLRLSHMSMKGLQELEKQGLLCGDKMGSLDLCENCVFGKPHRAKFPKGVHRSKHVLDYVRTDLWGPAQVSSLSGGKYFMTLIDDHSRKVWLYILKTKDQVVEKFKVWKVLVENQSGKKLKALRIDNGMKFCNREFKTFC